MKLRSASFLLGLVLPAAVIAAILVTPAAAKKPPKPPPPPPPPPPSTSTTYVKNYANVLGGTKCDVTPAEVRATSDGGSVALALSSCRSVSWVVKLDAFGNPQWQEEVGCLGLPPGGHSLGVALQTTADGGYVIAGGARDCQSNPVCPYLSSIHCGLVVKLDSSGAIAWSRAYSASATSTSIEDIRQTSDGGFVAVGNYLDADSDIGGLVLKLDGSGNVQWQRLLNSGGPTDAYLNAVVQAGEGGYVAAGELAPPTACQYGHGCGQGVLAVKLDAGGSIVWQRAFNSFDADGEPTASEHALSLTRSADGGYLIAGNWRNTIGPGTCCRGALLLKLDANGNSQWQKAHSGGVHCFFNGFNTTCHAIGADVYSVHQTADGGYSLAGSGDLRLNDGAPLVPWLAKADANGNLVWQRFYYQTHPRTGRGLSQYFASSALASNGGYLALGFTSHPTDLTGELLAVKTDSAGNVGACSQVQPATPLNPLDPGLATIAPGLAVQARSPAQGHLPTQTQPTSIGGTSGQC
jgi:hypothetical protein